MRNNPGNKNGAFFSFHFQFNAYPPHGQPHIFVKHIYCLSLACHTVPLNKHDEGLQLCSCQEMTVWDSYLRTAAKATKQYKGSLIHTGIVLSLVLGDCF